MNNIIGIGTDIIKNQRIKISIKNKKFVNKIFSKKEINQAKYIVNKANFYAKRFCGKEAFVKALGTGVRYGINFKDISIVNTKKGKPIILLNDNIKRIIKKKKKIKRFKFDISLSDEKKYSLAFVVLHKI